MKNNEIGLFINLLYTINILIPYENILTLIIIKFPIIYNKHLLYYYCLFIIIIIINSFLILCTNEYITNSDNYHYYFFSYLIIAFILPHVNNLNIKLR